MFSKLLEKRHLVYFSLAIIINYVRVTPAFNIFEVFYIDTFLFSLPIANVYSLSKIYFI